MIQQSPPPWWSWARNLARFVIAIATPAAFAIGVLVAGVNVAVQTHIMVTYPSGRISTWPQRLIVWAAYLLTLPRALLLLLLGVVPYPTGRLLPGLLILRRRTPATASIDDVVARTFALAISVALILIVAANWRRAGPAERRALAPAMLGGALIVASFTALVLAETFDLPPEALAMLTWVQHALLVAWPAALLYGLLRSRLDRAAVGELIVELSAGVPGPDRLQTALATALHDPTLHLAFWLPVRNSYVDAAGRAVDVADLPAGRAATYLERDGAPIAFLVHDAALIAEPELVSAVAAGAGLAVENERLHAEVRAQLDEVRASRARIVAAGDTARRRVERDLHDGAQQRLVGVALALRMARTQLEHPVPPTEASSGEVTGLLETASNELAAALDELRELARGIYPAVLTDGGLTPALRSLSDRAPIPVVITATPPDRLPAVVEQTCYFLVSEALTNAAKYAAADKVMVAVTAAAGTATVEISDDGVGGADPARGSGLRGIADRGRRTGRHHDR
jgi:signal transduction histidine kinase